MNGRGNLALTRPHGTNGNVMLEVPVSRLHLAHCVSCKNMDFQLGWCKSLMQDLLAWKLVTGPIHGLQNLMDPSSFAYLVGITAFNGRLAFYLRLVLHFHLFIYSQRLKTAENISMCWKIYCVFFIFAKFLQNISTSSFDKRVQFLWSLASSSNFGYRFLSEDLSYFIPWNCYSTSNSHKI